MTEIMGRVNEAESMGASIELCRYAEQMRRQEVLTTSDFSFWSRSLLSQNFRRWDR